MNTGAVSLVSMRIFLRMRIFLKQSMKIKRHNMFHKKINHYLKTSFFSVLHEKIIFVFFVIIYSSWDTLLHVTWEDPWEWIQFQVRYLVPGLSSVWGKPLYTLTFADSVWFIAPSSWLLLPISLWRCPSSLCAWVFSGCSSLCMAPGHTQYNNLNRSTRSVVYVHRNTSTVHNDSLKRFIILSYITLNMLTQLSQCCLKKHKSPIWLYM